MLAPLPALVTFPLDSGSYLSVLGTRVRLNSSIAPPGSMSSQYAVRKTQLQLVATAAAINVGRIANWLGDMPTATTRYSCFAALVQSS